MPEAAVDPLQEATPVVGGGCDVCKLALDHVAATRHWMQLVEIYAYCCVSYQYITICKSF